VAKRRRKKRVSFSFDVFKKKKRPKKGTQKSRLVGILWILAIAIVLGGIGVGFVFLQKYVEKTATVSNRMGLLELLDMPEWVSEKLKQKIYNAAISNGEDLRLDEDAAKAIQENISSQFVWMDDIKIQTTNTSLEIRGQWRKPLVMAQKGKNKCYVDKELVVLDFVEVSKLPIVKITGLSSAAKIPPAGRMWRSDDLAAGVDIVCRLDRMDRQVTPDKPLLCEIDRIDVSNFNGRKNDKQPHIILYTKNNLQVIWGAEIGTWQRNFEAQDQEKLEWLYKYYKENGTLLKGAKYINLREPIDYLPLPIDKY
jgi:hypothetical protein